MQFQKPLLFGLLLSLLPSCQSDPTASVTWDHWNPSSVPPRIERFFLSYDPDRDGAYTEKLSGDINHVRKIGNRVFLHRNTDNPFQYDYVKALKYTTLEEYEMNSLCSNNGLCYCAKCASKD